MAIELKNLMNKISLDSVQKIQKVIQYFPMVPEVERTQTVLRITNALVTLGEQVNISSKNCIVNYLKSGSFAEYVDWGYKPSRRVQFIIVPEYPLQSQMISCLNDYIRATYDNEVMTDTDGNIMFDRIFNRSINGGSVLSLYRPDFYSNQVDEYHRKRNLPITWYTFNNIVLNYCNKMVLSFMSDAGEDVYELNLTNAYMLDINEIIMRKESSDEDIVKFVYEYTNLMTLIPLEFKGIYHLMISKLDIKSLSPDCLIMIEKIKEKISNVFLIEDSSHRSIYANSISRAVSQNIPGRKLHNVINVLEDFKEQREDVMLMDLDDISSPKKYVYQYSEARLMPQYSWLRSTLEYFDTISIRKFRMTMASHDMNLNISLARMYALKQAKIIKTFIQNTHQGVTLGCIKRTCYILATKDDKIYMFPIFTGNEIALVRAIETMNKKLISRVIEFKDEPRDLMSTDMMVIEAANKIEFDNDTNLKFTFKRTDRNTYMNRYSEIHNVLVQNSRNRNYQAMKTDLARMYALIYIIERDVTHTTKAVSPSVKADATKARMFAKNDMKRYMDELLIHDKTFDLSKHFAEAKIKEQIEKEYEVKINALGVKKLLKTLI